MVKIIGRIVSVAAIVAGWLAVLLLGCTSVFGAGPDDELTRKAKVAFAMAGVPAPAVAPPPRPVGKLPYGEGYSRATADQQPLVVFVGCDGPKPAGAVSAKVDGPFAGVAGPAVVVGYPRGDRLWIDTTLPGPVAPEAVQKAADAARRKISGAEAPKAMPGPAPLDWQIRGPTAGPNCAT